eukprot:gene5015-biopygen5492
MLHRYSSYSSDSCSFNFNNYNSNHKSDTFNNYNSNHKSESLNNYNFNLATAAYYYLATTAGAGGGGGGAGGGRCWLCREKSKKAAPRGSNILRGCATLYFPIHAFWLKRR